MIAATPMGNMQEDTIFVTSLQPLPSVTQNEVNYLMTNDNDKLMCLALRAAADHNATQA